MMLGHGCRERGRRYGVNIPGVGACASTEVNSRQEKSNKARVDLKCIVAKGCRKQVRKYI